MGIVQRQVSKNPLIKQKLFVAGIKQKPEEYIKAKLKLGLYAGIAFFVLAFMMMDKQNPDEKLKTLALAAGIALIGGKIIYTTMMRQVDGLITKRAKEIDRDVLFAGRFLLVKLNSGKPLINALEDATKSYGVSNTYFKEIIREIDLGTPLERALEKSTEACPSDRLKKILFQITNALKIGTDVTNFLDAILDEIADEQLIEIQRYGKKLNSMTMFYMLFAVVMPSLGMTMVVIIISLVNINLNMGAFLAILLILIFMQVIFVTLFKSIRPNLHI